MVMYCPYCGNKLAEPIGCSCGSCGKDIRFLAPALDGPLSDEMTEAALFHKYHSEGQTFEGAKDLEPGDLIEIFRGVYQHWAVYIGDLYVVHFVAGINSLGASSSALGGSVVGKVRKDKLQDVINKDKWEKNNTSHTTYDKKLKPKSKAEIVKEALSMVGKAVKYSVSNWNCEHFATWCRYGKALSLQVRQAETVVGSAAFGSFSVMSFSS